MGVYGQLGSRSDRSCEGAYGVHVWRAVAFLTLQPRTVFSRRPAPAAPLQHGLLQMSYAWTPPCPPPRRRRDVSYDLSDPTKWEPVFEDRGMRVRREGAL